MQNYWVQSSLPDTGFDAKLQQQHQNEGNCDVDASMNA